MTILDKNVVIELTEEEKEVIERVSLMINEIERKMNEKHLYYLKGKDGKILSREEMEWYKDIFKGLRFEPMLKLITFKNH